MTDPEPETTTSAPSPTPLNWDRIMALTAVALSVTAILVSLFEVNSVREHSRATVWPHISVSTDYGPDRVSLSVANKGVGPALVQDVAFRLDGEIVTDIDTAIRDTVGTQNAFSYETYTMSDLDNAVLAAGESTAFFSVPLNDKTASLLEAWSGKVDLELCYCSIQRDCWRTSMVAADTMEVDSCAVQRDSLSSEPQLTVSSRDFQPITGREWTGTLQYRDYSSDEQVSIPVTALVKSVGSRTIVYQLRYPKEPDYNSNEKIRISSDKTRIDGAPIVERGRTDDGRTLIVAQSRSTDNDEPADMQTRYEIGPRAFDISQWVKPDGQDAYFERNRYSFSR